MSFKVIDRTEQPYVGIKGVITMQTFDRIADRLPDVYRWLESHGVAPAGPSFFKFNVIDMERELEVEVGVPTASAIDADGEVFAGALPAGRYVTATHIGDPDELVSVTADVLDWAESQGLKWDTAKTEAGRWWGCRLVVNKTGSDPALEEGQSETELLFRLAD